MAVNREASPHVKAQAGDDSMRLCASDNTVALSLVSE